MSHRSDIVINPSEVVALSERLGASDNQARPLNAREVISMTSEPYKSTGNQARLNNGCVCNEGCESCNQWLDAFEAMREALIFVSQVKLDSVTAEQIEQALRLADRVKEAKP